MEFNHRKEGDYMEIDQKHERLGVHTKVLLQLHLSNPKDFDPLRIVTRLFEVYEELDLEEDWDEKESEGEAAL